MIYIISGIAKSGKTFLAKKMLKEHGISNFSTDYLMMSLSLGDPKIGVNHEEDDKIVSKHLEPFLYPMILAMIQNKLDYCIEGVHFNPDFSKKLIEEFKNQIKIIYLGYADVSISVKKQELIFYQPMMENCWYKNYSEKQLDELVEFLIQESINLKKACALYHLPYYDITSISFQADKILEDLFASS